MPTVTVQQFEAISTKLFIAAGAREDEAKTITESLLFASLRGHDTHGVGHLPLYVRNYLGGGPFGGMNKEGSMTIVRETPATVVIDANWCLGQKVAMRATEMLVEKARKTGISAATINHATHIGALSFYTAKIVEHDMIGIGFVCAGACTPPLGGVERLLGTNPMSIGIPTKKEPPIIVDMATSATTWMGLLPMLARGGGRLPEGLILDDHGEPTTDPGQFSLPWSKEEHGAIANMGGGPKGYSIQVAVEMLGGVLPALMTGNEIFKEGKFNNPCFLMAINIAFFQDVEAFKEKVDARATEIRASKKMSGVDAIHLPGERSFRTQQKRLKEGIPIHEKDWEEIAKLADELKIDLPSIAGTSGTR
jgi:LDH2 family malate/lactate/ureidoglycolate dehydrogenase